MDAFVNFAAEHEFNRGGKLKGLMDHSLRKKEGQFYYLRLAETAKLSSFYYKCGFKYEENFWLNRYVPRSIPGLHKEVETLRLKIIKEQIFWQQVSLFKEYPITA